MPTLARVASFAAFTLATACSNSDTPAATAPTSDSGIADDALAPADARAPLDANVPSDAAADTAPDAGPAPHDAQATTDTGPINAMPCDLQITADLTSNIGISELAAAAGQGTTTNKPGHPQNQGIQITSNTSTTSTTLDIDVSGVAPTVGASYTVSTAVDAPASLQFVYYDVTSGDLKAWDGADGGIVTVSAIGPAAISSAYTITFAFNQTPFTPRTAASSNKATGTFKVTGQCQGVIAK